MPIDRRGKLEETPFSYHVRKDGALELRYGGRVVKTVRGAEASALAARLAGLPPAEVQLALAKATGNFKRGNERR